MTPGERAVWIAVYAASWHQSTGRSTAGALTLLQRAEWCAIQAGNSLDALRLLSDPQSGSPAGQEAMAVLE